ncbi:MAG: hypothetical protein WCJ35_12905 [Planctomycetota bacterium]
MLRTFAICAASVLIIAAFKIPAWAVEEPPQAANKTSPGIPVAEPGRVDKEPQPWYTLSEELVDPPVIAGRFGYWGSHTAGNVVKVGEYQDLTPSPFVDIDGLHGTVEDTLNYTLTETGNESTNANVNLYKSGVTANVLYERYPHQLDHDPLSQFTDFDANPKPGFNPTIVIKQDLNVGKDYAIRVQEVKANFKGRLTENLKVRLDVFGMDKEGERQARGSTLCFQDQGNPQHFKGSHCHVLSQSQSIDWQTLEVKPAVEWKLGSVIVEYSRPMRSFSQNDQIVNRQYTGVALGSFESPVSLPYAIVPSSFTQIDQLKVGAEVTDTNKLYAFLFNGNTHKESGAMPPDTPDRESSRSFRGADVRWTNTLIENLTVTSYGRIIEEDNQPVAFPIPGEENTDNPDQLDILGVHPINYKRSEMGSKFQWRPFGRGFGLGGLAIDGGYEYAVLHRSYASFPLEGTIINRTSPTITEENTISHAVSFGPSVRWSPQLDTYVRYKWFNFRTPLFGVDEALLTTNSSLPEHENLVEIGGTWMPSDRVLLNGWIEVDIRQSSGRAIFDEQSYPMGVNGWYRPTNKLTISGGFAYYSNWINQNINFGTPNDSGDPDLGTVLSQWNYGSRAEVFNLGCSYACTKRLKLVSSTEYVKGIQSASLASGPAFLSDVLSYSKQDVRTTRVTVGADYQLKPRIGTYFRYLLFDYNDSTNSYKSGTSNMFLGGLSAIF